MKRLMGGKAILCIATFLLCFFMCTTATPVMAETEGAGNGSSFSSGSSSGGDEPPWYVDQKQLLEKGKIWLEENPAIKNASTEEKANYMARRYMEALAAENAPLDSTLSDSVRRRVTGTEDDVLNCGAHQMNLSALFKEAGINSSRTFSVEAHTTHPDRWVKNYLHVNRNHGTIAILGDDGVVRTYEPWMHGFEREQTIGRSVRQGGSVREWIDRHGGFYGDYEDSRWIGMPLEEWNNEMQKGGYTHYIARGETSVGNIKEAPKSSAEEAFEFIIERDKEADRANREGHINRQYQRIHEERDRIRSDTGEFHLGDEVTELEPHEVIKDRPTDIKFTPDKDQIEASPTTEPAEPDAGSDAEPAAEGHDQQDGITDGLPEEAEPAPEEDSAPPDGEESGQTPSDTRRSTEPGDSDTIDTTDIQDNAEEFCNNTGNVDYSDIRDFEEDSAPPDGEESGQTPSDTRRSTEPGDSDTTDTTDIQDNAEEFCNNTGNVDYSDIRGFIDWAHDAIKTGFDTLVSAMNPNNQLPGHWDYARPYGDIYVPGNIIMDDSGVEYIKRPDGTWENYEHEPKRYGWMDSIYDTPQPQPSPPFGDCDGTGPDCDGSGSTPQPDPKPEPQPDPKPEPQPEPKPEPQPEPKPEPQPEPKPEPQPEPWRCPACGRPDCPGTGDGIFGCN